MNPAARVVVCTLAALWLCPLVPISRGQDSKTAAGARQAPPEAAALLKRSRDAIAKLSSLSYTARVTTQGIPAPTYDAEVHARRVDAGGWAIAAKGAARPAPGGATADPTPFEVAYDGVTSRALREKDRAVVELSTTETAELRLFFTNQGAAAPVAWEMLGDPPLAPDNATLTIDGDASVGDVPCRILKATFTGDTGATTVRVYIAADGLPRRIERVRAGDAPGSPGHTQVLVMNDLKPDLGLGSSFFAIHAPDGFTVKSARPPAPKRKPRERDLGAGEPPQGNGLLAVGSQAPDWTLTDASGRQVKLSALRGRVVVLDFWATWCGPCKMAMPSVQKLHEKYKDAPVSVYGVNCWESADAAAYMRTQKLSYGLLLKGDEVAKQYKVQGIPTFYVIGSAGEVLWNSVGFDPAHADEIAKVIDAALKNAGL